MGEKQIKTYGDLACEYSNAEFKNVDRKKELQAKYGETICNNAVHYLIELYNYTNGLNYATDTNFNANIDMRNILQYIEKINKLKEELNKELLQ